MAIITFTRFFLVLTVCSARPPQPKESNDVFDYLRRKGIDIPDFYNANSYVNDSRTTTTTGSPTPYTTPTTTPPLEPQPDPQPTTTTPPPTPTTPTTPTTPPAPTTTTPPPTPHMKLVRKQVITLEDFVAESEL